MDSREKLNVSLGELYDSLFLFESPRKTSHYPIHKRILIEGRPLLTWLFNHLPLTYGMTVLDAGCGTGHALFRLIESHKIHGVGLSISKEEITFAKSVAKKLGIDSLNFHQRDISEQTDSLGKFDLILAIESLKHTQNPIITLAQLVDQLTPEGIMVLVDDFLMDENQDSIIDDHKKYWNAPGFMTIPQMKKYLYNAKHVQHEIVDLSKFFHPKPTWFILIITRIARLLMVFLPRKSFLYRNLTTFLGAMILELLYHRRKVGYFTYIIRINKSIK